MADIKEMLKLEKHKKNMLSFEREGLTENYHFRLSKDTLNNNKRTKFEEDVKVSLIAESMAKLFNECSIDVRLDNKYTISRNLINQFIEENGPTNILESFRKNNILLAEHYQLMSKYFKLITENAKDKGVFEVETTIKDDFFKDLSNIPGDEVMDMIRDRVSDSVENFIEYNKENKEKIKDIIDNIKTSTEEIEDEEIAESVVNLGKRKLIETKEKFTKSLLHCMVESTCEHILKDVDAISVFAQFKEDDMSTLNMEKVIEHCTLLYTFIEMNNSLGIKKMDPVYLKSIISNM